MTMTRFVPAAVKQPLKRWYFSHLLASSLASLRAGVVTDEELTKLRMGWANDGWDAKPVFLKEVIAALNATTGPILECGSGLSTVVMAALAPTRHRVSLENHANWARRVEGVLQDHELTADVRVAPLTDRGDGLHWYAPVRTLPNGIGLVICDGPDSYGRGRYPVLPLLRQHLAPNAVILFDDAAAEGQPEVLDSWEREFGAHVDRRHRDGVDYAVVRVP